VKKDILGWVALAAAIVGTASAEYELARACGFGQFVAATVPAALDVYAIRAYRQHRDGLAVLVAMIVVNALSHLVTANLIPVNVPLVVAVASLAPLVMWRVHRLHGEEAHAEATPVVTEAVEEDGPSPAKSLAETETPAVPEAEPEVVPVAAEQVPQLPRLVVMGPFKTDAGTGAGTGFDLDVPDWLKRPELEAEPAEPAASSGGAVDIPAGVSAEHVVTVKTWLAVEPELTGTEIGTRLGKSDGYGRRVKRAATAA
jgi:hypothetical protein